MKINLITITILIIVFFFIWNFSGSYSDGEVGMLPFSIIISAIFTVAILFLLLIFTKKFNSNYIVLVIAHQLIFQFSFLIIGIFLNNHFDFNELPIVSTLDKTVVGFFSRGMLFSSIIAYFLVFLKIKFIR